MSFLAKSKFSIFELLNACALLTRHAALPAGFQNKISFTEWRGEDATSTAPSDLREIKRFQRGNTLAVEKICFNENESAAKNEVQVINWIMTQKHKTHWMYWLENHAVLPESNPTLAGGLKFSQSFAGIDTYDLIFQILAEARSDSPEMSDIPLNRDPFVLLLLWRSVIKCLIEMHKLGLIHGDASVENFCFDIQDTWSPGEARFLLPKDLVVKAIDFGCTILPINVRNQYQTCYRQINEIVHPDYTSASGGDIHAYLRLNPSIDYYTLAAYIEYTTKEVFGVPDENGLQPNPPVDTQCTGAKSSKDSLEKAFSLLKNIPSYLMMESPSPIPHHSEPNLTVFQTQFYENIVQSIETAIDFSTMRQPQFGCPKRTQSNVEKTPDHSSASPTPSPTPTPTPTPTPPRFSKLASASLICLVVAGIYYFSKQPINFITPTTVSLPALKKPPVVFSPAGTQSVKVGAVSPSDPDFMACTSRDVSTLAGDVITRVSMKMNDEERSVVSAALKSCEVLLPRAELAHANNLRVAYSAAYYALLTDSPEKAKTLLAPALTVSDPALNTVMDRVMLAQAAVSAKLGDELGLYTALERSAAMGQYRQNLDDECPLHRPYQNTSQYQKLRAKFEPRPNESLKPLTKPAC